VPMLKATGRLRPSYSRAWAMTARPVCFPESPALTDGLTMGVPAPTNIGQHLPRMTINPRLLEAAPVLVVTWGASKAEAWATSLASPGWPSLAGGSGPADRRHLDRGRGRCCGRSGGRRG